MKTKPRVVLLSGDWTELVPGVHVRLRDAPNEEDMECFQINRGEASGGVALEIHTETPGS